MAVCNLKQNVSVTGLIERAITGEVFTSKFRKVFRRVVAVRAKPPEEINSHFRRFDQCKSPALCPKIRLAP